MVLLPYRAAAGRLTISILCCAAVSLQSMPSVGAQTSSSAPISPSVPTSSSGAPQPGGGTIQTGSKKNESIKESENRLQQIVKQAAESEGALFVDQDKVQIKAPLLSALIELHRDLSPYGVDASGARSINLRDVLLQALAKNLEIEISNSDMQSRKWLFRSALGGFLPTIQNGVYYQGLSGAFASPFGAKASLTSPFLTIPSGLVWNFFDGGSTIFGSLKAKHEYKAAKYNAQSTSNDVLFNAAKQYYELALQNVILQVRIKAAETSQALVETNRVQYQNGANTQLDVLQAETQLARDRQALIAQQIVRRKAALALSTLINLDSAGDLNVSDHLVSPMRLIDDKIKIAELVQMAIDSRPELKKWEQERLAAKDAIGLACAPLLPTITGSAGLASTGAKVARGSGSSSGATVPATGSFGAGGGFSSSSLTPTSTSSPASMRFSMAEFYLIGIGVQWNIGGLGLTDYSKIQAAKWLARKAQTEFTLELTKICQEVRDAYVDSIDYENQIAATTAEVFSARRQLEVAVIRLDEAVGTDLDVVNAQRDYTSALINKATAIIQFNQAQARLLRAIGRLSVDNLVTKKPLPR